MQPNGRFHLIGYRLVNIFLGILLYFIGQILLLICNRGHKYSKKFLKRMQELNHQKQLLHNRVYNEIWEKVPTGPICSSSRCVEKCCEPNYSRYGVFDYFLMLGSPNEIDKNMIDIAPLIPGTKIRLLTRQKVDKTTPCLYFKDKVGCILSKGDRPIICVTWCCKVVAEEMPEELRTRLQYLKFQYNVIKLKVALLVLLDLLLKK